MESQEDNAKAFPVIFKKLYRKKEKRISGRIFGEAYTSAVSKVSLSNTSDLPSREGNISCQPRQTNHGVSGLGVVLRATKLCDEISARSNILIDNVDLSTTPSNGAILSTEPSRAEAEAILRSGEAKRHILRLCVFVNSLIDSTLSGPDRDVNISHVQSAIGYIFSLLTFTRGSSCNSSIPAEAQYLLDSELRRIFTLANSHPNILSIILQNVDILVLEESGRLALGHLVSCNSNFATHLQLHLIRSMTDAGTKLEKLASITFDDVSLNGIWQHRQRYQNCAMLLLSTLLTQKCSQSHKSKNGNSMKNTQNIHKVKTPVPQSIPIDQMSQASKADTTYAFIQVGPMFTNYSQKLRCTKRKYDFGAVAQLERLRLDPKIFPSLVIFKDKILERLIECEPSLQTK